MPIKIAGYNIDADLLERFKTFLTKLDEIGDLDQVEYIPDLRSFLAEDNLTPETLSAAYARISRYPDSVSELRKIARQSVARARRSNRKIVFDMGHASVAEHAVFNIDITGVSRLAIETIEARRLISFTEKSQRYIALSPSYIIPLELTGAPLGVELEELCEFLFNAYHDYLGKLEDYFERKAGQSAKLSAQEDARYLLPLASGAQLGMTANARNIEHLLRRTLRHPLIELRQFADELKNGVIKIVPSLIRHLETEDLEVEFNPESFSGEVPADEVQLLHSTENADDVLLTALIFAVEGFSWENARMKSEGMKEEDKRLFVRKNLENLKRFHTLPRAYETVEFAFQVTLSATAYAQLKRHRLTTQLVQPYHPDLGYTLPKSIEEAGLNEDFNQKMNAAAKLYREISAEYPYCAPYALTNAHRRVVYLQANARELHHIARLRMDKTAQWDIRAIVTDMVNLARKRAPLTMALTSGKDEFTID
ncbi:MAG: FAD-dependent thymidylate synthase [candidate division Zixibacteria bacterium]|nr:FAD-dependent thymidylate synthase [Candidatus Tariuqbacter arcticus]